MTNGEKYGDVFRKAAIAADCPWLVGSYDRDSGYPEQCPWDDPERMAEYSHWYHLDKNDLTGGYKPKSNG